MGKASDRYCQTCIENPYVKGDSWSWHCQSKHPGVQKEEIKFQYVKLAIFQVKDREFFPEHDAKDDSFCNDHLQEIDKNSQLNFSTNYENDWEKLSRTFSSISQMSEAAKLLLEEKDKRIARLEEQALTQNMKLELRDAELIQLKTELGVTTLLQKQLKEKEDVIIKLNTELHEAKKGSPINPHKQCEALELQLRQQLKESEELSQATFEKLNQRIEELKNRLKVAEGKQDAQSSDSDAKNVQNIYNELGFVNNEKKNHSYQYLEEIGSDESMVEMMQQNQNYLKQDENEERKGSDIDTICPYCNIAVTGPPLKVNFDLGTIQVKGVLINHFKLCQYFIQYQQRLKEVAEAAVKHFDSTKQHEIQSKLSTMLKEQDNIVQCLKISTQFNEIKVQLSEFLSNWKMKRRQSYPSAIFDEEDSSIEKDLEHLQSLSKIIPQEVH